MNNESWVALYCSFKYICLAEFEAVHTGFVFPYVNEFDINFSIRIDFLPFSIQEIELHTVRMELCVSYNLAHGCCLFYNQMKT